MGSASRPFMRIDRWSHCNIAGDYGVLRAPTPQKHVETWGPRSWGRRRLWLRLSSFTPRGLMRLVSVCNVALCGRQSICERWVGARTSRGGRFAYESAAMTPSSLLPARWSVVRRTGICAGVPVPVPSRFSTAASSAAHSPLSTLHPHCTACSHDNPLAWGATRGNGSRMVGNAPAPTLASPPGTQEPYVMPPDS